MTIRFPPVLTEERINHEFAMQVDPDWQKLATCIQCGTCSASCPASGLMDYPPRQLWELVRLGLIEEVMNSRTFWLCTQCYACQVRCPRGIHLGDTMRGLREWAIAHSYEIPQALVQLGEAVKATRNILNEDNTTRLIWAQNLDPRPDLALDVQRGQVEVLLFTGCVSAFYPMAYSIPQSLAQMLEQTDVTYTAMGGDEWCCGYPLYAAGMQEQLGELATHNIERARAIGAETMVITCSSCYHTWLHLYPSYTEDTAGFGFKVVHASEFLADFVREGRIKMADLPWTVTYHDPCDLGRKNGIYDAPRFVINSIPGMTLVEMINSRENAMCCGGGGDVAMMEADVTESIAEQRLNQAVATGAEAIISSCQQCKRTLLQAARKTKTRIRVLDVTELAWQAMEK